jgi:hypothetical protein
MSERRRRYELLLPLRFNDGTPVPADWLREAVREIVDRFGGASFETQTVLGQWKHGSATERDELNRLAVDLPDSDENRAWMRAFKERWQVRLRQDELWLASHVVEVE